MGVAVGRSRKGGKQVCTYLALTIDRLSCLCSFESRCSVRLYALEVISCSRCADSLSSSFWFTFSADLVSSASSLQSLSASWLRFCSARWTTSLALLCSSVACSYRSASVCALLCNSLAVTRAS